MALNTPVVARTWHCASKIRLLARQIRREQLWKVRRVEAREPIRRRFDRAVGRGEDARRLIAELTLIIFDIGDVRLLNRLLREALCSPKIRGPSYSFTTASVGARNDFQEMAIGILEIDSTTAIVVVNFAWLHLAGVGPIRETFVANTSKISSNSELTRKA